MIVIGVGKSHNLVLSWAIVTKQAIQHTSTQKANEEDEQKSGEEKATLFEYHFRSGGEENKRKMSNNLIQEMKSYDG